MTQSPNNTAPAQTPVAIIGIGCQFPGARNLKEYWRLLRRGEDAIKDVPPTHWRKDDYVASDPGSADLTYCGRGGFLDPVDFDPARYGIPPTSLEATDTSQLISLMAAQAALDDAGYTQGKAFDRARTSVILGVTGALELVIPLGARLGHPIWRKALTEAGLPADVTNDVVRRIADEYVAWQEGSFPGLLGNVVAGRIANRLDLKGANCVVDAACASSLSAIHLALLELHAGRADMVLSGGSDTFNDIFMFMCFTKTQALSKSGDARPFSAHADGTVLGEGVGVVVLKRLADAQRDGDRIYAVIRGVGAASDGRSQSIYAPLAAGQAQALKNAYEISGVTPDTIGLIEAHGTGTKVGDATEFEALASVYKQSGGPPPPGGPPLQGWGRDDRSDGPEYSLVRESLLAPSEAGILSRDASRPNHPWCALGSVKSQIGHTKAAAGVAGLIKAALALHHQVIPPTIKVGQPIPAIDLDDNPFYLSTESRPWLAANGQPRRAAVSAFGFGGSNFHAVLEEHPAQTPAPAWDGSVQIIALAADTHESLAQQLQSWKAFAAENPSADVIAHRAAQSRRDFDPTQPLRLTLVLSEQSRARKEADDAQRPNELTTLINTATDTLQQRNNELSWSLPNVFFDSNTNPSKIAFLFPGQASQHLNMGRDLACIFPEFRDALAATNDPAITDAIYPVPTQDETRRTQYVERLAQTQTAQPALGAISLAMLRVLERFDVRADFCAGHSFGELVALRAAGSIDDNALHQLAAIRGKLMATGDGDRGTMLAVAAPIDELQRSITDADIDVVLANRNAPNQGILSGATTAIDEAERYCAARGWRTTRLAVSAAFHSRFMADASGKFREALDRVAFNPPRVPVYSNNTAQPMPHDANAIRDLLAGQLTRPVDFVSEIVNLHDAGARLFLEVGPKTVLISLVGAILADREHEAIALDASAGKRCGITDLARVLARLAAAGHRVKLVEWDPDCPEPLAAKMRVPLVGANYRASRKPLPPPLKISDRTPHVSGGPTGEGLRNPMIPQSPTIPERKPVVQDATPMSTQPTDRQVPQRDTTAPALPDVLNVVQEGLKAMQALQQQTAKAHERFLEGQELAHKTFRQVIASQQRLMEHALGAPVATPAPALPQAPVYDTPRHTPPPPEIETVTPVTQSAAPEPAPAKVTEPVTTVTTAPAAPSPEVERILLEVVAELTGYPIEMLDADMDLEADLGIDSIKRVEILACLQERVPEMQAVNSSYIGGLRTLRNIIEYIREPAGDTPKAPQIPQITAQVTEQKAPRLERRVLRAVELTGIDPYVAMTNIAGKTVWITEDGAGVAQALCDRLVSQGVKARTVSASIDDVPADLAGLVIVASPASVKGNAWPAESEQTIKSQFALIQRAAASLQRSAESGTALLATVSRMDGQFGLRGERFDPVQGGLAGLVKTAAHEWPNVRCRAIDVAGDWTDANAIAESLVAELLSDGPVEVGLDSRKRYGLKTISQPAAPGDVELHDGDAVIITGGARGVTAAAAIALAKACRPTLVLFGRSAAPQPEPLWLADAQTESAMKHAIVEHQFAGQRPSPADVEAAYRQWTANRQIAESLSAIERSGGRAVYRSLDVRDAAAVVAAIQEVRQEFGPIRGLIHGAGVIEDRLISDKQLAQFDRVFDTKVAGLRNLLAAIDASELRFAALFSSVSGRFGRQGQSDYAAANEVLNKAAQRLARALPACRVVSLNWGPWQGGMVTPALEQEFRRIGVGLIPLEAGAAALVEELSSANAGEAEVLIGDGFPAAPKPKAAPAKRIEAVDDESPAFERRLDVQSHAFLRSHVIGGRPVLPVAMMLEWLGHAALHENPGLQLAGFDDFRVLRGVALDDGECRVRGFASRCHRGDEGFEVDAWLSAESADQPNARARAILVSKQHSPPQYAPPAELSAGQNALNREEIYGSILFHGSHFQGIDGVLNCSKRGMVARVFAAPAPSDWMDEPLRSSWLGDPLVIDVGLQLGIVWSHQHLGAASLPSFVKRYRQYRSAFPLSKLTAALDVRQSSENKLIADVHFLDADGILVAQLEGVEWTVDASLSEAFRQEAVAGARV